MNEYNFERNRCADYEGARPEEETCEVRAIVVCLTEMKFQSVTLSSANTQSMVEKFLERWIIMSRFSFSLKISARYDSTHPPMSAANLPNNMFNREQFVLGS